MIRDGKYMNAVKLIEQAAQSNLKELDLSRLGLNDLPESIGQLTQLESLSLYNNLLVQVPESLGMLTQLRELILSGNLLTNLPGSFNQLKLLEELDLSHNEFKTVLDSIGQLENLQSLDLSSNRLNSFPKVVLKLNRLRRLGLGYKGMDLADWKAEALRRNHNNIGTIPDTFVFLPQLEHLDVSGNNLIDIPTAIIKLENLKVLILERNPLNPELAEAYEQGMDATMAFLRARAAAQIILNEAKLILVGEGEVGKTCLMDALLDKFWTEHPSTHGINIQQIVVNDPETQKEIILNGWDFGGQKIYRPTHQLFFSAPAVYLVVWKPREGCKQNFVEEWIQLIQRREPSAKILMVATHGGPQQRQPDIDRQELWDLFGRDTVIDFFFVDSKPDANGYRKGIAELKEAIAGVAATLPELHTPLKAKDPGFGGLVRVLNKRNKFLWVPERFAGEY